MHPENEDRDEERGRSGMSTAHGSPDEYLARFGLRAFRPAQRDVIDTILAGQDCLCIMPTGGGKSLCYQLPALMMDGLTLVISPLIALMKDQVDALCDKGIAATFINSTLSGQEQHERLDNLVRGEYTLVYVAPERFRSQRFVEIVRSVGVKMLAVDEAHCISEWGHDFRHDYSRLGLYRQRIGAPPTIALTATATPDVQTDVVEQLQLASPATFVAGFARENLHYQVIHHSSASEKDDSIDRLVRRHQGAGIIYVSTRKACELVATRVKIASGRAVGVYHAGLPPDERKQVQEDFMQDRTPIVVATNAFGMGIDKPDVRFVIHYNMPGTLEAYYQEAGRAGRDGQESACILLYAAADLRIQRYFIESSYPDRQIVRQVLDYLRSQTDDPIEVTQQELRERLGLDISNEGVGTCERLLEKAGAIQRLDPHRNMAVLQIDSQAPALAEFLPSKARNARRVARLAEQLVGDMRYEPVYVDLQRLIDQSGLAPAAVRKALGELSQLELFHYVPPFRGRAIHITQPPKSFDELEIDFQAMTERKAYDYEKLQRMVDYAFTRGCRQLEILKYFGEPSTQACLNCDICRGEPVVDQAIINLEDDATLRTVVRIALSGVARAKERFGKSTVAEMLYGSQSARIKKLRLDRLSTFGRLKELRKSEVTALLDVCLRTGWVEQFELEPHRPLLRLTESGVRVMKDEPHPPGNVALPKRLVKKLRATFGKEAAVEIDTAAARTMAPAGTRQAASDGVPPERRVISKDPGANHLSPLADQGTDAQLPQSTIPEPSSATATATGTPSAGEPVAAASTTYDWTWRLIVEDGYSLEQMQAIRNLDEETLCEHLQQAVGQGRHLPIDRVWTTSEFAALERAFSDEGPELRRLQARLETPLSLAKIGLYLKCRATARERLE